MDGKMTRGTIFPEHSSIDRRQQRSYRASDRVFIQRLCDAVSLRAALAEARHAAVALPALVQAERLVLGMPTDHHQVDEVSPSSDPVAAAIVRDPRALDVACELLDIAVANDTATEDA